MAVVMALVPLTEQRLMLILPWRNAPAVRQSMFHQNIISEAEHQAWFLRLQQNNNARWFVHEKSGVYDGVVYFTDINLQDRSTLWGFYLAPDAAPGSGTLLGIDGLDMAFDTLQLETVYAKVLTDNKKSIRFHLKLGFEPLILPEATDADDATDIVQTPETQSYHAFSLSKKHWQHHKQNMLDKIGLATKNNNETFK